MLEKTDVVAAGLLESAKTLIETMSKNLPETNEQLHANIYALEKANELIARADNLHTSEVRRLTTMMTETLVKYQELLKNRKICLPNL